MKDKISIDVTSVNENDLKELTSLTTIMKLSNVKIEVEYKPKDKVIIGYDFKKILDSGMIKEPQQYFQFFKILLDKIVELVDPETLKISSNLGDAMIMKYDYQRWKSEIENLKKSNKTILKD